MALVKQLFELFTSIKLAAVLLMMLIGATAMGVTVWDQVFGAWWFIILAAMLWLNTLCCTLRQWGRVRRRVHRTGGRRLDDFQFKQQLVVTEPFSLKTVRQAVIRVLRQRRYRWRVIPGSGSSTTLTGGKFAWAHWGIIILHCGLLLIIIGGLITFTTSFRGSFWVLKDQVFTDSHSNYVTVKQGPFYPRGPHQFQVMLDDVVLKYNQQGMLRDYEAAITILEQGRPVKKGMVSGPRPLQYKGIIFYKKLYGYAPGMTFTAPGGESTKFRVVLDTAMQAEQISHQGEFRLPGTNLEVTAAFYPDLALAGQGNPGLEARRAEHPGLVVKVGIGDRNVYQGNLLLGERIELAGNTLSFDNYLPWYGFSAVSDRGITVVFTGCWVVLLGAALIYLVIPREIAVCLTISDQQLLVVISGLTSKYQNLFAEELEQLVVKLRDELATGGMEQ